MRNELRIAIRNAKKQGISTEEMLSIFASEINETGEIQIRCEFLEEPTNRELEEKVTQIIHEIGIPAHIKGYRYIRSAVVYAMKKPSVLEAVTKELYPDVAKMHQTTGSRVERAIRHAIEAGLARGDVTALNKFGYNLQVKPTNSEFIAMIVDYLKIQH